MASITNDDELLFRTAWLYYIENLTQKEIAQRFNISRIKVVRLLRRARENDLVEIHIKGVPASRLELERSLRARLGLVDARVTATPAGQDEALRPELGAAAAAYLLSTLRSGTRLGLGLGRTLAEIPRHIPAGTSLPCHLVEMVGGIGRGLGFDSYKVSSQLADRLGGDVAHIYSPVVVESASIRDAMLGDPQICRVLELAGRCDLALVSVGTVDFDNFLYQAGLTDEAGLEALAARSVGDILGHFFDCRGCPVTSPIDGRLIGLSLNEIKRLPLVVCVAGGSGKVAPIVAAARGGYIHVLITDEETAEAVLALVGTEPMEAK